MGRLRVKYKNARDEYIRCRALGTLGMGYRVVARKHGIAPVLLSRFNKGEYQEGLDSTDADDDSSDEASSTGDFLFPCRVSYEGHSFIHCWCGATSGHGRVSPCTYLVTSPAFNSFLYFKDDILFCVNCGKCVNYCL